jgi:C-terminal processing protease CtpA/Prc
MVGRLDEKGKLILQGVGSSTRWPAEIERRNVAVGLPVVLQRDSFLPTDSTSFFTRGIPAMSAFTGSHEEYHTPRDTPDKLNYEAAARIARLFGLIARSLASDPAAPDYIAQAQMGPDRPRGGLRAYLGTIPDYSAEVSGVKISGVTAGAPADDAGLKSGDVIVELAGKKIKNIYDYTFAIEALKVGKPVMIAVIRDGQRTEMQITPESRD